MMTVGEFAGQVFIYCRVFAGSVTSWIRTPGRNKAVGGVPESAHPFGLGADVVYADTIPATAAEADRQFTATAPVLVVAQRRANALGLEIIRETDKSGNYHDHLQPRGWAHP